MENRYFIELTSFASGGEERNFIYEIDLKTFFDFFDQSRIAVDRYLTFAVLTKADS